MWKSQVKSTNRITISTLNSKLQIEFEFESEYASVMLVALMAMAFQKDQQKIAERERYVTPPLILALKEKDDTLYHCGKQIALAL